MKQATDREFASIAVGESASFEHHVTADDVDTFATISGDSNPLHVDDAYAKATSFGKRVVHGMFLCALVSQLVGMHLPGKRALLMKESLEFSKPVYIGDTVSVSGTVGAKSESTRILSIDISITAGGNTVAEGAVSVRVLPV